MQMPCVAYVLASNPMCMQYRLMMTWLSPDTSANSQSIHLMTVLISQREPEVEGLVGHPHLCMHHPAAEERQNQE